jgi:Ser/Thr protein kinase RdoA (MazF antagonist)
MSDGPLPSSRTEVHRAGNVIHRSAGPWSSSVHALLRHLEAAGFDGAPRVVGDGFDEQGREVLTYIDGDFVHAWSDDGIAALGAMLRSLHDASRTFQSPPDATWQPWFTRAAGEVFGHGDVGPWNIVARDGLPVAFIDWEFAGPVDRLDEVAQAAWLNTLQNSSAEDRARQVRLFADGYRLPADARALLVPRAVAFAARDAAQAPGLKMAKHPPDDDGVAWRIHQRDELVRHRALLEAALR